MQLQKRPTPRNEFREKERLLMRRQKFEEVVSDAAAVMGVKAVFDRLNARALCFGGRGTPAEPGRYYQAARTVASKSTAGQPVIITIGGGADVSPSLRHRVINIAFASGTYGNTDAFVDDPGERDRLLPWPTAVALRDVWEFEEPPHLNSDLGLPDSCILENAFDAVVRPEGRLVALLQALKGRILTVKDLPPIVAFRDEGKLIAVGAMLPRKVSAEEGARLMVESKQLERDRQLVKDAKEYNREQHRGLFTCEGCGFADTNSSFFDAHHLVPLAIGSRVSTPSDFAVLCPTCHRIVHRNAESAALPLSVTKLKAWWAARRNQN
jgi:hypothetical protein